MASASILYVNTRLAADRVLDGGIRQRTRVFRERQSHYVFADRFRRPGKGNDESKVAGRVGSIRGNFLVPLPRAASFAVPNAPLLGDCRLRLCDQLRGHDRRTAATGPDVLPRSAPFALRHLL